MLTMKASGCRTSRLVVIFAILASLLAGSCTGDRISSRDQAAGVLLSSTAIPWQQVAASLRPGFSLTGDAAAQMVAPVTQQAQLAVLNALGIGASAGALVGPFTLPASGASAATTPASVPNPSLPTGVPGGGALLSAPGVAATLPIDPMLQYRVANALYQFVQLLNADLSSSLVTDRFVPYIVRLKLTVRSRDAQSLYDPLVHRVVCELK